MTAAEYPSEKFVLERFRQYVTAGFRGALMVSLSGTEQDKKIVEVGVTFSADRMIPCREFDKLRTQ